MAEEGKGSAPKGRKAPGAFRTISEVSAELDVPQHVLRFWETKFPVVKPLKRGGGRRYYRPADVELVRGIRDLLYTHGFTIKGAQKLLKEQGNKIENIEVLKRSNSEETQAPKEAAAPTVTISMSEPVRAAIAGTAAPSEAEITGSLRDELESLLEDLKSMRKMLPK